MSDKTWARWARFVTWAVVSSVAFTACGMLGQTIGWVGAEAAASASSSVVVGVLSARYLIWHEKFDQ